ncbi:MAG: sigma-70 family RNA polymerase sigma factor [Oscillospiraceae bacterium]|jgi:RNA polymerase sigma-70 factor (ECF subfamily)|nr:sigma-70 family RNA polymerase sigma factor [Oscillospiraceae bacterium]
MTREEELILIAETQNGDSAAFERLVLENQAKVYNLALRMVGNEDDAFDMSQEAFIKTYNAISNFRGDSRFSVWLYRLTTNVCLDFLRAEGRRPHSSLTYAGEDEEEQELEIPDERFSPETLLEKKALRETVAQGLMRLPEDYRAILLLREIDGLSYDEIAEVLSLESGTVKSRIFRARKRLCAILSADGNFSEDFTSKKTEEV